MEATIPKIKRGHSNGELPQHIERLITTRNRQRRLWQRSRLQTDKLLMNLYTAQIKIAISEHRNEAWYRRLSSLRPTDNTLWRQVKMLTTEPAPLPALSRTGDDSSETAISDRSNAEMLAEHYVEVHHIGDATTDTREQRGVSDQVSEFLERARQHTNPLEMEHMMTRPSEVREVILRTVARKAPVGRC
ncbi:PREDICTED: uncharacterized protein LOC108560337 [Nicrophorus vespilloides]|uniref:Uncharacterized protein LOC108560337 n=1 Tax=Nicrophorus vespilloides TaxID=110193 RepID=A0ABM1MFH8_NICVS|nr:PREDICTED: uncharacterized protein LOC108560337 [Nicrophorus vespilloides]